MQLDQFSFDLPSDLIAQHPLPERSTSRLLVLRKNSGSIEHLNFKDLPDLLNKKDLLVFNDTKVIPARIWAKKESGGKAEVLFAETLGTKKFLAHLKANKPIKIGTLLFLSSKDRAIVIGRKDDLFVLELQDDAVLGATFLKRIGHIPLPPYINRSPEEADQERYQTIFARNDGAIAAPTAGLHFDAELLNELTKREIESAFITLHVGAGTFQPVRSKIIEEHKMHKERVWVPEDVCQKINSTKNSNGRVVAIGTTVARSLETAAIGGIIKPFKGETDIFIYPGYQFNAIDALLTNFHLPQSTLLMLVSAFAGYDLVMQAYREAIERKYRFFSYGDAMLII